MKRIQIVGPSGAGKTVLAQQLSKKLSLPHHELDLLFWLPEWREKPREQYILDVNRVISEKEWVLCGNYLDRLDGATLKSADTVIWLNYPPRIYLTRMVLRTLKRTVTREKLWGHSRESAVNFFLRPKKSLFWMTFRLHQREGRRRYEGKINEYKFNGEFIELTSPKETELWLKKQ